MNRFHYLLLTIAAIFAIHYGYSWTLSHDFECLTSTICFEAPADRHIIAALRTLTWLLGFAAFILTLRLMGWIGQRGWLLPFGGVVMIALSIVVTFVYLKIIDQSERVEFIHIPILGALIGGLGLLIFVVGIRQRRAADKPSSPDIFS